MMEMIDLPPLFPEKQNVLNKINEYFVNNRMGYIKVPTGWGKTFLSKHLMKQYYERGKILLFLVSQNIQLLDQTFYIDEEKINPLFPDSSILSSHHRKIGIEELIMKVRGGASGFVIFANLQTVLSKKNTEIRELLSQNTDLVIIDEVHNFIHNKGNEFIDEINENAKILGMTATPFQGVVGNVKFVDDISGDMKEIYNKTLPQCIIDGQLSELSYTIIRSNQNILEVFDFEKGLSELNKKELHLDCSTLEKINLVVQRTCLAKKVYDDKIKNKNSKTLIFCAPVRNIVHGFGDDQKKVIAFHAKLCSAVFNGELKDKFDPSISFNNYSESGQFKDAVYLSSELPKKERNAVLEAFRTIGEPPFVLCTVGMLIEGFDFPSLENLVLLRPTLSMRLFEQQVGRVTRPADDKNRGNIFEIVDDITGTFFSLDMTTVDSLEISSSPFITDKLRILVTPDSTANNPPGVANPIPDQSKLVDFSTYVVADLDNVFFDPVNGNCINIKANTAFDDAFNAATGDTLPIDGNLKPLRFSGY